MNVEKKVTCVFSRELLLLLLYESMNVVTMTFLSFETVAAKFCLLFWTSFLLISLVASLSPSSVLQIYFQFCLDIYCFQRHSFSPFS